MTDKQVKALRASINAAHAAGNTAQAAMLQAQLHAHFVEAADAFVQSAAGRAHVDALAAKMD